VPAESFTLHVHNGVLTRMGASDNLMAGRSTFLEELGDASQVCVCGGGGPCGRAGECGGRVRCVLWAG
jgi:hypothetical protein